MVRAATVTWGAESATSPPVTVNWVARQSFSVTLAADIGEFDTVGDVITYTATVTNTGNETDTPDAGHEPGRDADLHPGRRLWRPGASTTCTGTFTTTTGADVTRTATVTWGADSATSDPVTVAWVARRGFTVTLAADISEFDTVGDVITYSATVTNTGNETDTPDAVTVEGTTLTCTPTGPLDPGDSTTCTGTLTTTTGADVTRTATVTWGANSATSDPVTVTWVARRAFTVTLTADPTSLRHRRRRQSPTPPPSPTPATRPTPRTTSPCPG